VYTHGLYVCSGTHPPSLVLQTTSAATGMGYPACSQSCLLQHLQQHPTALQYTIHVISVYSSHRKVPTALLAALDPCTTAAAKLGLAVTAAELPAHSSCNQVPSDISNEIV